MKETVVQEAYRLLKNIPEKQWCIGDFTNYKDKCCALGHYNRLKGNPKDFSEENCDSGFQTELRNITSEFISLNANKTYADLADINNGDGFIFKLGKTNDKYYDVGPKQRTILFLKWMISEGY